MPERGQNGVAAVFKEIGHPSWWHLANELGSLKAEAPREFLELASLWSLPDDAKRGISRQAEGLEKDVDTLFGRDPAYVDAETARIRGLARRAVICEVPHDSRSLLRKPPSQQGDRK